MGHASDGFIFLCEGRTAGDKPRPAFRRIPREWRRRRWVGWGLAPTLSVISMLGVFLLVVGEGLVVLSFCVRDERREQAPALHYLQAYPLE